jgi:hypothetical protein
LKDRRHCKADGEDKPVLRLTWFQAFFRRGPSLPDHHQSQATKIIITLSQPSHFSRQGWSFDSEATKGGKERRSWGASEGGKPRLELN